MRRSECQLVLSMCKSWGCIKWRCHIALQYKGWHVSEILTFWRRPTSPQHTIVAVMIGEYNNHHNNSNDKSDCCGNLSVTLNWDVTRLHTWKFKKQNVMVGSIKFHSWIMVMDKSQRQIAHWSRTWCDGGRQWCRNRPAAHLFMYVALICLFILCHIHHVLDNDR
jgi:hypothetical protein